MSLTTPQTAPLKVIIVEDTIRYRQHLERFLQQQPGFTMIAACSTVYDSIVTINNTKPDLVLLDINLPDGTGYDILKQISVQTKVLFLTAHPNYAIMGIRYAAIDYLLKPYKDSELEEALQRVISAQPLLREQIDLTLQSLKENKVQDKIALRSRECVKIVKLKEINYFQEDNGYTTVFLQDGTTVVTTIKLEDYKDLLSGTFFLNIHQSCLANERYIKRYHKKEGLIYLRDGTAIPVSIQKKEMVDLYFKNTIASFFKKTIAAIFKKQ